jgi:hypothetical protein
MRAAAERETASEDRQAYLLSQYNTEGITTPYAIYTYLFWYPITVDATSLRQRACAKPAGPRDGAPALRPQVMLTAKMPVT